MSNANQQTGDEPLVQPSKFGKRLGRFVTIVLALLAVLVLLDLFSG